MREVLQPTFETYNHRQLQLHRFTGTHNSLRNRGAVDDPTKHIYENDLDLEQRQTIFVRIQKAGRKWRLCRKKCLVVIGKDFYVCRQTPQSKHDHLQRDYNPTDVSLSRKKERPCFDVGVLVKAKLPN